MFEASNLHKHLIPGMVYKYADLRQWSDEAEQQVKKLETENTLKNIGANMYYYPRHGTFGEVPPNEKQLISTFLGGDHFLLFPKHIFNGLGVGTTQLYNETLVYNYQKHGRFVLADRTYEFLLREELPRELDQYFLLVELVNSIFSLAEAQDSVLENVVKKLQCVDRKAMLDSVQRFAHTRSKDFFSQHLDIG